MWPYSSQFLDWRMFLELNMPRTALTLCIFCDRPIRCNLGLNVDSCRSPAGSPGISVLKVTNSRSSFGKIPKVPAIRINDCLIYKQTRPLGLLPESERILTHFISCTKL